MAEKMTLEKLTLMTARGFEDVKKELKSEIKAEINALRKEMYAEFKLVHQEIKVSRESHDRRIMRLEEKVL